MKVTDEMVTRFLGWSLPKDFAPDGGISFKPLNHPNCWPVGTNLFTADQARQMLEHILTQSEIASGIDSSTKQSAQQSSSDKVGYDYSQGDDEGDATYALRIVDRCEQLERELAEAGEEIKYWAERARVAPSHGGEHNIPISMPLVLQAKEAEKHGMTHLTLNVPIKDILYASPVTPSSNAAVEALRELVRLKDIKDILDDNDAGVRSMRADQWAAMAGDYKDNKPKAWQLAREVLAGSVTASATEPSEGYPGIAHDLETLRTAAAALLAASDRFVADTGLKHGDLITDAAEQLRAVLHSADSPVDHG